MHDWQGGPHGRPCAGYMAATANGYSTALLHCEGLPLAAAAALHQGMLSTSTTPLICASSHADQRVALHHMPGLQYYTTTDISAALNDTCIGLLSATGSGSAVRAWSPQDVAASQRQVRHLLDICSRVCGAEHGGAPAAQATSSGSACLHQDVRAALALALRAVVQHAPQVLPGLDLGPASQALAATACIKVSLLATFLCLATQRTSVQGNSRVVLGRLPPAPLSQPPPLNSACKQHAPRPAGCPRM